MTAEQPTGLAPGPSFVPKMWAPGPENFDLTNQEIHVWRARLQLDDGATAKLWATLSIDEKCRAAEFAFERDRRRFIAARGTLRDLLGRYLGLAASELKFTYGARGKPGVISAPTVPEIHFNLAHSGEHSLFAFGMEQPLGIDLEFAQRNLLWEPIAERYFADSELAAIRGMPEALRVTGFYRAWTRKEAYFKAVGSGLHLPLRSFNVAATLASDECVLTGVRDGWNLVSFSAGESYPAALVYGGRICQAVRCFSHPGY